MAKHIKDITSKLGLQLVFKSSFDKANRTSSKSFRAPGMEEGLKKMRTMMRMKKMRTTMKKRMMLRTKRKRLQSHGRRVMQISESLKLQMEVQKRLHEQLEVQRQLRHKIAQDPLTPGSSCPTASPSESPMQERPIERQRGGDSGHVRADSILAHHVLESSFGMDFQQPSLLLFPCDWGRFDSNETSIGN